MKTARSLSTCGKAIPTATSRFRLMGRRKRTAVRRVAQEFDWLDPAQPLPEDPVIARQFGRTPHLRVDDGLPKTSNSISNGQFSGMTTGSQAICRRFTTRLLTPGDANGTHSAQRCLQPIMIVLDDHSVGS